MWRKHQSNFCLYITILNFLQIQSSVDPCTSEGYRFCEADLQLCRNTNDTLKGYVCICPEGQSKVDGHCKGDTELTTTQDSKTTSLPSRPSTVSSNSDTPELTGIHETETSSSSSLSSTVSSNSGIENTPSETLDISFKTDFLFTTLQPIKSSSMSSVSLTTVENFLGSTSEVPVSEILGDDECLKLCSHNMTCIRLSHRLTCQCKAGFVLYEDYHINKSSCIRNCLKSGCEDACRQMKCILPEDKKKNDNPIAGNLEMLSGWPLPAILVCACLGGFVVALIFILVYTCRKYAKNKQSHQLEENKVVYQKMNRGLHTESVLRMLQVLRKFFLKLLRRT